MGVPRGPDDPTGPLPTNPIVERGVDETDGTGLDELPDSDLSNKEFRYNPPTHAHNLHRRVDFGHDPKYTGKLLSTSKVYDESGAPRDYKEDWASKNLQSLRLGRIIQNVISPGHAALSTYRWGFRFLYNPTSLTIASTRNDSFTVDGRSEANVAMSGVGQNYQWWAFNILLDRVPDVMAGEINPRDYSPSLRNRDVKGLKRYGTHWDLEALYKVANGDHWDTIDRGKTGNIGVLMPSNARLILGKGDNLYGFVESVSYNDIMFSQEMVPIRTEVTITFRRHLDMTIGQIEEVFPGIALTDTSGGSADNGTVGNNSDAPLPGYNKVSTGFNGYPNHNGWDYRAPYGTPVHATHSGTVDRVRYMTTSYGRHVMVKSGRVLMIYAHMSSINPSLKAGSSIREGDWIGKVGSTGNSTGNHLHYEERVDGKPRIPVFARNTGSVR